MRDIHNLVEKVAIMLRRPTVMCITAQLICLSLLGGGCGGPPPVPSRSVPVVDLPSAEPGHDIVVVPDAGTATTNTDGTFSLPAMDTAGRLLFVVAEDGTLKGAALAGEQTVDSAATARAVILLVPGLAGARPDLTAEQLATAAEVDALSAALQVRLGAGDSLAAALQDPDVAARLGETANALIDKISNPEFGLPTQAPAKIGTKSRVVSHPYNSIPADMVQVEMEDGRDLRSKTVTVRNSVRRYIQCYLGTYDNPWQIDFGLVEGGKATWDTLVDALTGRGFDVYGSKEKPSLNLISSGKPVEVLTMYGWGGLRTADRSSVGCETGYGPGLGEYPIVWTPEDDGREIEAVAQTILDYIIGPPIDLAVGEAVGKRLRPQLLASILEDLLHGGTGVSLRKVDVGGVLEGVIDTAVDAIAEHYIEWGLSVWQVALFKVTLPMTAFDYGRLLGGVLGSGAKEQVYLKRCVNSAASGVGARAIPSSAAPGETVELDAVGDDPDGDPLTFSWEQIAGPSVSLDPVPGNGHVRSFVAPGVTQAATLVFRVTVSDQWEPVTADVSVTITPSGQVLLPNLKPAKASSTWTDAIVVSHRTGTTQDDPQPLSGDYQIYVDWAWTNEGPGDAGAFKVRLLVDGQPTQPPAERTPAGLSAGSSSFEADTNIGRLATGAHSITIVVDADGQVAETNEADNEYAKTITVIGGVLANAGPDKSIPYGGSAVLEGSATGGVPPYTYSWSPATGLDSADVARPTASPVVTTEYELTVQDAFGASSRDRVKISVGGGITVTAPVSGAAFAKGTGTVVSNWTSSAVPGNLRIDLVNTEGAMVRPLEGNWPNTGTYLFSLGPQLEYYIAPRSGLRIRVTDAGNAAVFGLSPPSFAITGSMPSDRLALNSPNGGESLRNGQTHTIGWGAYGGVGSTVVILIYKGGVPIGPIYAPGDAYPPNTGQLSWTVGDASGRPLTPGNDYQLLIRSQANGQIQDFSDGFFSVGN